MVLNRVLITFQGLKSDGKADVWKCLRSETEIRLKELSVLCEPG